MAYVTVSVLDYSNEVGTINVPTAGMIPAELWSSRQSEIADLETAIGGLTLGTDFRYAFRQNEVDDAKILPASPLAQREMGLRVFFHQTNGTPTGYITIPAVDVANLAQPNTDIVPLDDPLLAPLVTWLETNGELQGQGITVDRAVLVGRNS